MITQINNSAILMINKITATVKLYLQVISAVQGGEEPSLKLAADHWQVVDIMISINISGATSVDVMEHLYEITIT